MPVATNGRRYIAASLVDKLIRGEHVELSQILGLDDDAFNDLLKMCGIDSADNEAGEAND
ncbi:hypothetical protein B5F74_10405 [Collinsella sp. An271]|uniref:hypothetical protein n=1 Tax=Collinsella sp. An271 TaxID=1965616 RepID=UPI000B3A74EC|nr:hypothetical protein [Collinsella sp. An271]OUO58385.1 hypothetical protein B5F74_10405 [Collinsella sp. An271]